jgi:hypothetical protein
MRTCKTTKHVVRCVALTQITLLYTWRHHADTVSRGAKYGNVVDGDWGNMVLKISAKQHFCKFRIFREIWRKFTLLTKFCGTKCRRNFVRISPISYPQFPYRPVGRKRMRKSSQDFPFKQIPETAEVKAKRGEI